MPPSVIDDQPAVELDELLALHGRLAKIVNDRQAVK
jgi:hypothetical protein